MRTFVSVAIAFVALGCSGKAPAPAPVPPAPSAAAGTQVDLEQSFMIPQKEGGGLSHTPAVVFTADGKRMVTATSEREVVIFEVGTRKLLRRIAFPEEVTDAVSIDGSGRYAVWAMKKGGIAVMEIDSEKIVARDEKLAVKWVAVSPDGRRVALSRDKEIEIRDLPGLKLRETLGGHEADVTNLAWSADGKLLGSTATDGRLLVHDGRKKVYEAKKGQPLHAVAFHPKGGFVAYGGNDQKVYQYGFSTEREEVISQNQPYWITCLGYSPDGGMIAVGDESCDIWLYRLKDKHLTFHNKHHVECWLSAVAWAPDNETFLFGCRPNSHAGKPAVYALNTQVEAARSESARRSREALLKAVDGHLAKVKDDGERKSLEAYRKSLADEEKLQGAQSLAFAPSDLSQLSAVLYSLQDFGGPKVELGGPGAAVKLPPELEKMAKEHQETLQKEMKQLSSQYCVNQWKVKK